MKLTNSRKIVGSIEMLIAAVIIVFAVVKAPNEPAPKPVETTAEITTQAETTTEEQSQTETSTQAPKPVETTEFSQTGEYQITNSIIVFPDSAMEMYSISRTRLSEYAATVNTFAAKVPDKQVYCMLVPTRIAFYGPQEYRTGSHSAPDGINIAYSQLASNVISIDAYSALLQHTDDYIYFRTDHHWTARGAYYAYSAFCEKNGLSHAPLSAYQSGRLDNFVGTMYRYTNSENLKNNPDYVEYFMPIVEASGEFYSTPDMSDGKPLRIISTNITDQSSKYMCFIQGDKPLERIVTSNQNGKKILVIKESYGNAMVPFLLENYNEVFVLDPRQDGVKDMNLTEFVNNNGINEILFINYLMAPSNSKYMTALNNIINK